MWEKLGKIFEAKGTPVWMCSHATHPVAEHVDKSIYRIFFTSRDSENKSQVGFLVIDLNKPSEVLEISSAPVITFGKPGYFDDSGAQSSCLVELPNGRRFFYYLGWNLGVTVPWRNSIGLAVQQCVGSPFEKISVAPIIDRDATDPLTLSYPWVLYENGRWRMWYGSHLSWATNRFEMMHVIRTAESTDGITWTKRKEPVLNLEEARGEFAHSRPCVIRYKGIYRMWFSCRYKTYRMGYAESKDGLEWQRDDVIGALQPSSASSGWDNESVEYASVFTHDNTLFMLYNGNQYGRSGFGLARFCD